MAFDPNVSIRPVKFGELDMTFDEKGSTFLAMRMIQWVKDGEEPDESKAHLELRKWRVTNEGEERADKGFSFLTDNGPHELVKGLIHEGYGKTKEVLEELSHREDFKEAIDHFGEDEDSVTGEYYDMRKLLQNIDDAMDDNEEDEEDGVA
jgi:hypothetical protein